MKSTDRRTKKQVVAFRGINYSDRIQDGDLRDSLNLSARRYPYMSTRRAREKLALYSAASAMTARGSLVVVQGTNLIYDGQTVGQVTAGEKQFAVVNTKMVIWPDKVYLDLNSLTILPLEAEQSGTGAAFTQDGKMTVSGWADLTQKFKVGDAVTISGCAETANNRDVVIKSLTAAELGVGENVFKDATETGTVPIARKLPELDFICESENRLWGCSNEKQTIYASALGDPTNFFVYEGLSTDSYALAVGTEGDFTGCCKLASSVLFWKETKLHKLLGSYPAEYALYTYDIEGLQAGSHKSLQVINETLYYLGVHGVYAYAGGMPQLISSNFGDRLLTDGVAGNDGDSYYLSVHDAQARHLFVYETTSGLWVREDDTDVVDFARISKDLYFLDTNGYIWLADSREDDPELPWMAQFAPFYDTAEGRKRYSRLLMRVELPKGAWMRAQVKCDDGRWKEAGKIVGRDMDSIPLRLPLNRCDRFEVRLSGCGACTVKAMILEYTIGSDV